MAGLLWATSAFAVVPPGGTPAPPCDTSPQVFPKRMAMCGPNFGVWDSVSLIPYWTQAGYWAVGNIQGDEDFMSTLMRLDDNGNVLTKVTSPMLGTSLLPTNDSRIVAYQDLSGSNELTLGLYASTAGYTPVFEHKLFVTDDAVDVTTTNDARIAVTQNLDTSIEVIVFNDNGSVAWAKRFASTDFGLSGGGFPNPLNSQSVGLFPLPDGSFMLQVRKTELNLSTFSAESLLFLVKLSSTGAVEWAKKYDAGPSVLPAFASPVFGSAFYINTLVLPLAEDPVPENVITKLNATGDFVWSKKIVGPVLSVSPNAAGGTDETLILTGFGGDLENPGASMILASVGPNGTLDAQAEFSFDDFNLGFVTVEEGRVWVNVRSATQAEVDSSEDLPDGPVYIGLTDLSLSTFQWKQYALDAAFGFMVPDFDSTKIAFSAFSTAENAVDAIIMNDDFTVDGGCDLLTDASVTVTDPGLEMVNAEISLMDFTVTASNFVPEMATGSLTLEDFTCNAWDLCTILANGGGGGGGGGGTDVTLPVQTDDVALAGGEGTVSVTTDATDEYTVSTTSADVTITSPTTMTGPGVVMFTIAPNATPNVKTHVINIGDEMFTITQPGMTQTLEVLTGGDAVNLTGADSGPVEVLSQVPFDVRAPSWILIEPSGGGSMPAGRPSSISPQGDAGPRAVFGAQGLTTFEWSVTNAAPLADRTGVIEMVDAAGTVLSSISITQSGVDGVGAVNMSARTQVGTGDNILIPGVVIGGAGKTKLLVRGVGPTLEDFGLTGILPDPQVLLFQGSTQVGENDSWKDDETVLQALFDELGAFSLTDDLDSATLFELDPGPYTIQLKDGSGASGVGIVELYVIDASANGGLVNLSARAEVGSGDRVMIPGFVINGNESVQVLVRGVGPTLGTLGVQGVLEDPEIEVFDSTNTAIDSNDDWDASLAPTFDEVGAFPLDTASLDAAILLTLAPGSYTAQIRGKGDAVGVALLEVYFLITY